MSYAYATIYLKKINTPEELEGALEELLKLRSTSILRITGVNVNQSFTFDIEPIISKIRIKYNKYLICLDYDEINDNLLRCISLYNRSKDCGCDRDCDGDCDWYCYCDCDVGDNDDDTDDDTDDTDDETDEIDTDDTDDETDEIDRELDEMMRPCA